MKVSEFVKKFIVPNTLIRIWYKNDIGGYDEVISGDKPMMEHQLSKSKYKDNIVVGVTDILYMNSDYIESVNLVIER